VIWTAFCRQLDHDPSLHGIDDPITLFQLFAQQYRLGTIAPSGGAVRSHTVEGALHAMGQMYATLGYPDPRLAPSGKLDFHLSGQFLAYKKEDPPPHRVKPIPFPIIAHAADFCRRANTLFATTLADMLIIGFYFLLRPGEYAATDNPDASPFHFQAVHLLIRDCQLNNYTATDWEHNQVSFITLEFTNQKNGVRSELIGLGWSGHPTWCPVHSLINRIKHLRSHGAPSTTPIYRYKDTKIPHGVT